MCSFLCAAALAKTPVFQAARALQSALGTYRTAAELCCDATGPAKYLDSHLRRLDKQLAVLASAAPAELAWLGQLPPVDWQAHLLA